MPVAVHDSMCVVGHMSKREGVQRGMGDTTTHTRGHKTTKEGRRAFLGGGGKEEHKVKSPRLGMSHLSESSRRHIMTRRPVAAVSAR